MEIIDWKEKNIRKIADYLLAGKPVVLPTDTIYGLVAIATNPEAVESVYELKSRNVRKKCILLISGYDDLEKFGIKLSPFQKNILKNYWPGKVSVELVSNSEKYAYLQRGTESLSFRYPKDDLLIDLLKLTGPLVAPSANPEGMAPAKNVDEARKYFGDSTVLFVDAGEKSSPPSILISLLEDKVTVLRP